MMDDISLAVSKPISRRLKRATIKYVPEKTSEEDEKRIHISISENVNALFVDNDSKIEKQNE